MKKVLLGTTALVAATLVAAPGARASEKIKLELGGFFGQVVGFADQDDDYETATGTNYKGFDQKSASEIHVKGETKLDNGITVGMRVEFESDSPNGDNGTNGGRNFDETFMYLESAPLGRLEMGTTSGPAWNLGHRAPNASLIGINTGDILISGVYIVTPGEAHAYGMMGATGAQDGSMFNRVNYVTPRFMGFGLGLSWVPDSAANNNTQIDKQAAATFGGSYYSTTLAYDETLMGVKVGADVHWARKGANRADPADGTAVAVPLTYYGGGLNLGYAGFVLGGSYERQLSKAATEAGNVAGAVSQDGYKWELGLSYGTGPYTVSFAYTKGSIQGDINQDGDDEYNEWVVGFNYNLGAGVDFNASVFRGSYDDETSAAANNNSGLGGQAGILLTF
jgi:predicted porin